MKNWRAWATVIAAVIAAVASVVAIRADGYYRDRDARAIQDTALAVAATHVAQVFDVEWPGRLKCQPVVTYRGGQVLQIELLIRHEGHGVARHMVIHVKTENRIEEGPRASWPYATVTPMVVRSEDFGDEFIIDGGNLTGDITSSVEFYVKSPGADSEAEADALIARQDYELGCDNCPGGGCERLEPTYVGFPATPTPTATATPTPVFFVYKVEQDDSLSSIAYAFGVSVEAIVEANPWLEDPRLIHVGDILYIPGEMPPPG